MRRFITGLGPQRSPSRFPLLFTEGAVAATGGAVEAFVRSITEELSPIRINLVSPGIIDTPMSPLKGKQRKDFYKSATKNNIIKRAGTPEEVAKALLFAVENEFITGTTIDVDGGWILA